MPLITISGPIVDVEKKRKLAHGLTEVATEVYGLRREAIVVIIQENPPENVGVGGTLIVDRKHES